MVKKPAKMPPKRIPLAFPNFSFGNGRIGWSMTCISGVSLRRVTLANSACFTISVKIAVLAYTSTCRLADGTRFTFSAGLSPNVLSLATATPVMAPFNSPRMESV